MPKHSKRNLSQCNFSQPTFHMNRPGTETGPSQLVDDINSLSYCTAMQVAVKLIMGIS